MSRRTPLLACLAAMLGTCPWPLAAAEPATAPYRQLCEGLGITFAGDEADQPREIAFSTRSDLPDVKPGDIRLTLQAGDEAIAIPVEADGRFMLPLDRKWFELNAMLVSNQPRGTWRLTCDVRQKLAADEVEFALVSPHAKNGRISYATLERLAYQSRGRMLERALEKKIGRDAARGMRATGMLAEDNAAAGDPVILLFVAQDGEAATVAVAAPANPFRKVADTWASATGRRKPDVVRKVGPGMFLVHRAKDGKDTDPVLMLSDNPTWQCMLMDRATDDMQTLLPSRPRGQRE